MSGPCITIFLLSPARCGGERAARLAQSQRSELGARLHAGAAPIGDVFAWLSALYFRGKLVYAQRFGAGAGGAPGALVMAPGLGLRAPEAMLSTPMLRAMGEVEVESEAFVRPLARDARLLDRVLDRALADRAQEQAREQPCAHVARVVLLGSIATGKYIDTLLEVFGERLLFPETFVGRGDMSRGGVLLRASRSGEELAYRPVFPAGAAPATHVRPAGAAPATQRATLRGVRPPKL